MLAPTPTKQGCKTIDIKDIKDKKGFWAANISECLTNSVEKFKDQCVVDYYCRNNQSLPNPKTIKCDDGKWDPNVAPTCKDRGYERAL